MSVDRFTNVLPEITLIEMMVTIGLGVTFSDVLRVSRNYGRVTRALLANCTVVPAAALDPLLLFHASPIRRRISWRCGLPLTLGAATAYALFQMIVIALVALAWRRLTPAGIDLVRMGAA